MYDEVAKCSLGSSWQKGLCAHLIFMKRCFGCLHSKCVGFGFNHLVNIKRRMVEIVVFPETHFRVCVEEKDT